MVLHHSINDLEDLVFDTNRNIRIKHTTQPVDYQAITMGPEGLMVGIVQGERFTRERNMQDRDY